MRLWRGAVLRSKMLHAARPGVLVLAVVASPFERVADAQPRNGRIEGRVVRSDGTGVAGATVVINETAATAFTGSDGQFSFGNVRAGTYSISLTLGDYLTTITDVRVVSGERTTVQETVDWEVGFTDNLIVRGASRRPERILEAPAAAALIGESEIHRKAAHGQLAKLLEFTPGAQVTQGGLWDFNMGTRGFNRALSRRVAVLLDGRDLSLPFFGYQGWPAFSFPLDDLASVELVRGPNAALYGANASGGVISMTSKEPRFSRGGMVRFAFGELNTLNLETRWTGDLGRGWYARAVGGIRRSEGFAVSRVNGPEYGVACAPGSFGDCLPPEVVPLAGEDTEVYFGGVRLDKYLTNGMLLTVEGGHTQGSFGVYQVIGQRSKSAGRNGKRPWARVNIQDQRFTAAASYDGYYEPQGFVGLTTGTQFTASSYRLQVDGQLNRTFRRGTVQLVAGGASAVEKMDSFNSSVGRQTFLFRPISSNKQAAFAQATWEAFKRVRFLVAARTDWSSLHEFQLSPKGSVTYSITADHSVRGTYGRGFQVSNSLEYFLDAPVAPPFDLSALNAFCAAFAVDCRFGLTPVIAVGNEDLDVETVQTWEIGYKGILATRALFTLDYYRSRSSDITTSLLPQVGTPLGRLNSRFGPWQGPRGLPSAVVDQIRAFVPLLSNHYDGSNILAAASYTNFGNANIQGIDVGLDYLVRSGWRSRATYSWFDFALGRQTAAAQGLLLPNAPTHAFSAGVSYDRGRMSTGVDLRWVDGFRWADGYFLGDVPSYTTVDVAATYPLSSQMSVGVNVSNLFDNHHRQSFGGSLIRRRALMSLQYDW